MHITQTGNTTIWNHVMSQKKEVHVSFFKKNMTDFRFWLLHFQRSQTAVALFRILGVSLNYFSLKAYKYTLHLPHHVNMFLHLNAQIGNLSLCTWTSKVLEICARKHFCTFFYTFKDGVNSDFTDTGLWRAHQKQIQTWCSCDVHVL